MTTQLVRKLADLSQGHHVCPIYEKSSEQIEVAVASIKEGLRRGERCLYKVLASAIQCRPAKRITPTMFGHFEGLCDHAVNYSPYFQIR